MARDERDLQGRDLARLGEIPPQMDLQTAWAILGRFSQLSDDELRQITSFEKLQELGNIGGAIEVVARQISSLSTTTRRTLNIPITDSLAQVEYGKFETVWEESPGRSNSLDLEIVDSLAGRANEPLNSADRLFIASHRPRHIGVGGNFPTGGGVHEFGFIYQIPSHSDDLENMSFVDAAGKGVSIFINAGFSRYGGIELIEGTDPRYNHPGTSEEALPRLAIGLNRVSRLLLTKSKRLINGNLLASPTGQRQLPPANK